MGEVVFNKKEYQVLVFALWAASQKEFSSDRKGGGRSYKLPNSPRVRLSANQVTDLNKKIMRLSGQDDSFVDDILGVL
jgi:hypothetical protein